MDVPKPHPPSVDVIWARALYANQTPEQQALRAARERAIARGMHDLHQYTRALRKAPSCAQPVSPPPDSSSSPSQDAPP